MTASRLLILACSKRKNPAAHPLPALERYDGPTYQVLRRYARETQALPHTLALSAEFGLVPISQTMPVYDRRMTDDRASVLLPGISDSLKRESLKAGGFSEALFCGGQQYLSALSGIEDILKCPIIYANGSLGKQVSALHQWLYGVDEPAQKVLPSAEPVQFRGHTIHQSASKILEIAHAEALRDPTGAARFEGWYVPVEELRIAPKWLLSSITKIPVKNFRTADAKRVLNLLGIDVKHIQSKP